MSSIKRQLLETSFGVRSRGRAERDLATVARGGRIARTLVKSGPLRVTQVVLAPGGEIAEHQAGGPITVQPLEGGIRFTAGGTAPDLGPGQLLSAGPGIRHSVSSDEGRRFSW